MRLVPFLLVLTLAAGCGGDEALVHRLDEREANRILVALDAAGITAAKAAGAQPEDGWTVRVAAADAPRAQRLLAEQELPRARASGFDEVYAQPSLVPTPAEEHARHQHALAGELARSLEALEGVVGARVHLALPLPDPLRPGERAAPRAGVLVRCRPAACERLRGLEGGIRALVAGGAEGLAPGAVSVVVAEAPEVAAAPPAPARRSPLLVALAAAAALGAGALGAAALGGRGLAARLASWPWWRT